MIRAAVIGAVAGARSMTPLAVVANAARNDELPKDNGAPAFLSGPLVSIGTLALAVYELVGDKQKTAPDRIIAPAVVVRAANAAFAGAAVSPKAQRWQGAAVAGGIAVAASYLTWTLRMRAMKRYGQSATGFFEDAVVVPAAIAAATAAARKG